MKTNGFTLIETVLYIGLIMILLPSMVLILLAVEKNQAHSSTHMFIEQTSAILFSEFSNELLDAYSINTTSSTFDSNQSELVFQKSQNSPVFGLAFETDTVEIGSVEYNIGRIKYSDLEDHWLTPEQISVTEFRIEPVRNNDGDLTALNIKLELSPLAVSTEMDQANILDTQTTFYLFSPVTEL
ncbi:hypothetical protein KJ673_03080 [Patescibacteria group bacterium]|nr:hypothetical protein [Patescibacteria group bacterium]MCG2687185.1 hypothetical protein [Candidatus Parcubacteria bacterium]